jgi:imidazolonepropionase-like amidohydrolase
LPAALKPILVQSDDSSSLSVTLGSIEVGKVADFVLLSADPVVYDPATGGDPTKSSEIRVVNTYLGGQPTGKE